METDKEYMKSLIEEYYDCDIDSYDCINCSEIEFCYIQANTKCNSEYARSIDYGGYDTEEEFWENLFD
jgi:hypothetical protein